MASTAPNYPAIPVLYTRGSYYDVGYNIGYTFSDRIKRYWTESNYVNNIGKPYMETKAGKEYFANTLEVCKENFPEFIRELEGLASGCGLDFNDVFLLNISKEVENVLSKQKWTSQSEASGCSDVFVNTPNYKLLAHNEDCDPLVMPTGYIVKATIIENDEKIEDFTSYCYPGVLPGTTWTFNSHGLVFSIDGLYADHVVHNAPTRMFLGRSVIRASDLEEVKTLVRNEPYGVAYSFTLNIVDVKNPTSMWSIEIGPGQKESMFHVYEIPEVSSSDDRCDYLHFNSFKHLNISEIPNVRSSVERAQTADKVPAPRTRKDVLRILGDTSNDQWPIFRSPRPTDPSQTIFTALVEPLRNRIEFYQENPSDPCASPFIVFNVLDI